MAGECVAALGLTVAVRCDHEAMLARAAPAEPSIARAKLGPKAGPTSCELHDRLFEDPVEIDSQPHLASYGMGVGDQLPPV